MTFLDLSVAYPVLATPVAEVAIDGAPAPQVGPYTGAVVGDVGFFTFNDCTVTLTAEVRGWGSSWDTNPGVAMQMWQGALDYGLRWSPHVRPGARITGWWDVGTGARVEMLGVDWWQDILTYGLGAHTGLGLVYGRGPVRPTASVRLDLGLRVDHWDGMLVGPDGTTTWTYHPGDARLAALVGVELP